MKKIYNKFLLFVFAVLILPITSLLVGCGATPVNQAQGVTFLSNVQDEQGQAVFELDLGSPLYLPYKINPSSAYGYSPRFTAISGISGGNRETYSLDVFTGEFCINEDTFKDVVVEINVGSFSDTCVIKLKKYPIQIGIYDESRPNKINTSPKLSKASLSAYQINVAGVMATKTEKVFNEEQDRWETVVLETETVLISDRDYNFLIEADENSQTLINIPNQNRLNISTYNNYGNAKVKVALCDYFKNVITDEEGNAALAFEIEIDVYKQCSSMDMNFDGADEIVNSKSNIKTLFIKTSNLEYNADEKFYIMNYTADFYDEFNRLINDDSLKISCFVDKQSFVDIDNDNSVLYIKRPPSGSLSFKLEVWSNAPLETGDFCMIEINFNILF